MFSDGVLMLVEFSGKLLIFCWEIGEDCGGFLN
jgi:hypothetical protein